MAVDYSVLQPELLNDPAVLGLPALIEAAQTAVIGTQAQPDYQPVAAVLNAKTGPGAITLSAATSPPGSFLIPKTVFKGAVALAVFGKLDDLAHYPGLVGLADQSLAQRWRDVLQLVSWLQDIPWAPTTDLTDPAVLFLMNTAAAIGLLPAAQVAAIATRPGSRAEALMGINTVLTAIDIVQGLAYVAPV